MLWLNLKQSMMASALRYVSKFKSFVILFFTPILLLPLIILVPTKFARCAYVIFVMATYWCTEVIPLAVTALLPALLFPLLKVLDSKQCTSNVATTTLFLPIFASMSRPIGLNPLYVMLPCTLSASFAFMLPVATPPNAIVFANGHLKVSDMVKAGIMVKIIGVLCVFLAINT
ncbi:Solute carrier family 13 member 5 [Myotis brandtii]|uniref:Solute carrier family 13 member 5 n=1 Tax=Myotis brandtii TaxID=109478 RepID=S7P999_MYOBR|nr:Solute carrier family 13 member 5 [Myotis brandtii]